MLSNCRAAGSNYQTTDPVNALGYLRVMLDLDDIDETLGRPRKRRAQLVGDVVPYQDPYRPCYICGLKGFSSDSPRNSTERDAPRLQARTLRREIAGHRPIESMRHSASVNRYQEKTEKAGSNLAASTPGVRLTSSSVLWCSICLRRFSNASC